MTKQDASRDYPQAEEKKLRAEKIYAQAEKIYLRGLQFFRKADLGKALACFKRASSLDPNGKAKEATEMVERILNFRHADLINP